MGATRDHREAGGAPPPLAYPSCDDVRRPGNPPSAGLRAGVQDQPWEPGSTEGNTRPEGNWRRRLLGRRVLSSLACYPFVLTAGAAGEPKARRNAQ